MTNLIAATATGLLVLSGTAYADSGTDKDCRDFTYREDAQEYFDEQGYSADNDPEKLDSTTGEGDGKACEGRPSRPEDDEPADEDSSDESSDDEGSRDEDDAKDDSDDADSKDSDKDSDEDGDEGDDESGSQVTTIPRGAVEAGG